MSILEELCKNPVFADQPEEHLAWLAEQEERSARARRNDVPRGAPRRPVLRVFEGEIEGRRGVHLPSSREPAMSPACFRSRGLKEFPSSAYATTRTRIACSLESLPEMSQRMPQVIARMVGLLTDRGPRDNQNGRAAGKARRLGKTLGAWRMS